MTDVSNRSRTLCEAFQRTVAVDPDAVALRTVGGTQTLTWRQYAGQVRRVAAGLAAIGVERGDTVALMMGNRIEFYPVDVGAQHIGATSFSVYNSLSPDQLEYVFTNAGNRVVVCEAQYVERIRASGVPIEHVVCVDGAPEGTVSLEDLVAGAGDDFDFEATWRAVQPEDVATLIYTSGTTGDPKGVETTHAGLLFEAFAVAEVMDIRHGDRITSYLPSAHIADRFTCLYAQEVFGTQITVVGDLGQIAAALADCRPTVWGAVPRVWEKLKVAIETGLQVEQDETKRRAAERALEVGKERLSLLKSGEPVPAALEAEYRRADESVLSKLRELLGLDQVRWAMSGAAPIPWETLGFFAALGIPMAEVWGMSELTCVCSVSPPDPRRLGTVGRLLPGMEARITEDGELLVRGPLVMKGYRREPEKTAEAVTPDGWLHTGDVVTIDDDGLLRIVDRKKELIINAAGKNMSPANIENTIKAACPLIGSMVAIGDGRPYNTALVVLDPEMAAGYATGDASAEALAQEPKLVERVAEQIAEGNARLSRVEQVKRFRILPTYWDADGDELTPTLKLKRKPIAEKYATEIEELYSTDPRPEVHEPAAAPVAAGR